MLLLMAVIQLVMVLLILLYLLMITIPLFGENGLNLCGRMWRDSLGL